MAAFKGDSIFWIETSKIVPNPYQPRREFDEERLKELADSIRMYGVLQPLTVSRKEVHDEDGAFRTEYELIAGERRLRASKMANVEQVPVIIREGEDSEQEKLELAIIENLQREDLNAVDRALAFKQLADLFDLSHAQVAKKVGRSREYVSNSIRLLNLPEYMLDSVKTADISEGHARTLLMLNDRPEEQDTLYRETLLKKLTVREVERIARKIATDKVRKQHWKGTDPELIEKEKQFTETLGTRVQLTKTDYGGKITIDYFSDEDLDVLLASLGKRERDNAAMSAVTSAAVATQTAADDTIATLADATPLTPTDAPVSPLVDEADTPTPHKQPSESTPPTEEPGTREAPAVHAEPTPTPTTDSTPTAADEAATPSASQPAATQPTADSSSLRAKLSRLFSESAPSAPTKAAAVAPATAPEPEVKPHSPEPEPEPSTATPSDEIPTTSPASPDVPEEKEPTPATDEPTETKKESPTPTSDDDLYGLKNFSV